MHYTNLQLEGRLNRPGKTGVDWYIYYSLLENFSNMPFCDVGVGAGGSTFTMLDHSNDVTVVDNWQQGWTKNCFSKNIKHSVNYLECDTQKLNSDKLGVYAIVHLDADKSYNDVLNTLTLFSNHTDIIIIDDYMNSVWPDVTFATERFLERDGRWSKCVLGNHQLVITRYSTKVDLSFMSVFPLIDHGGYYGVTYGDFDKDDLLDSMIKCGKLKYSWHDVMTKSEAYDT